MKNILITGASKGIGFETAKQLAELGHRVYLGCRDRLKGEAAIKKLNSLNILNASLIEIDVTKTHSINQAKQKLETEIEALDCLINNAGIAGQLPQHISSVDMENLKHVFDTNFFGAVQTTQAFIPLLKKSASPHIINVASSLASLTLQSIGNPNWRMYDAYSCSKTALNAFTVVLANELKNTNFKVNSVEPGYTATDLNEFRGTQPVEQAAAVIIKAATLDNDFATGQFFKEEVIPW